MIGLKTVLPLRRQLAEVFITAVSTGNIMRAQELLDDPQFMVDSVYEVTSPLHIAVANRDYLMLELLLSHGLDPNTIDMADNATIIHRAATLNEPEAIRMAASRGGALNVVDSRGLTPLHYAAMHGSLEAAQTLLDCGATPEPLDSQGKSPRYWADTMGHPEVAALLPEYVYNWEAVEKARMASLSKYVQPEKPKKGKKKGTGKGKKGAGSGGGSTKSKKKEGKKSTLQGRKAR